jgi:hypothetical protein
LRATWVYEMTLDTQTLRYAPQELSWGSNTYSRLAVASSEIVENMGLQINEMSVIFSNVQRTLHSYYGSGTSDKLTGRKLTARILFRDDTDTLLTYSYIAFVGRMEPPKRITNSEFEITATELLDGVGMRAPRRRTTHICPWQFKDAVHCTYTGADTSCTRAGNDCSSKSMTHNFGGFPAVEVIGRIRYKSGKES